jgi:hypothetical protein
MEEILGLLFLSCSFVDIQGRKLEGNARNLHECDNSRMDMKWLLHTFPGIMNVA